MFGEIVDVGGQAYGQGRRSILGAKISQGTRVAVTSMHPTTVNSGYNSR